MIRQELNPETCNWTNRKWPKVIPDCDNSAANCIILWLGVLSLAPCYVRKKQVRDKGVPSSYHHGKAVSSLVDDCQTMHPPPALFRKGEDGRKKKREVLHLFRCYTHTHTRPEPGQPRKARGRKKRTHDGQTAKTSAGGEGNRRTSGTNLHGETDLTKTAHTPKPHDTLRRGTRGKLGTKWGTSWWQTRKPKQLVKQQDSVPNCLDVVRLFPAPGPWSSLAPIGIKQLSSSIELGAQYV